jgi:hypothetical protein
MIHRGTGSSSFWLTDRGFKRGRVMSKPEPLASFVNAEAGVATYIYHSTYTIGHFNVVLRDTDAEETVGAVVCPTFEVAIKEAKHIAHVS